MFNTPQDIENNTAGNISRKRKTPAVTGVDVLRLITLVRPYSSTLTTKWAWTSLCKEELRLL